jgi:hypothetical protein
VRAASFVSGRHPKTFTTAVFKRCLRHVRYPPNSGAKADIPALRICADIVAKVLLHWGSEILRAAGATFV